MRALLALALLGVVLAPGASAACETVVNGQACVGEGRTGPFVTSRGAYQDPALAQKATYDLGAVAGPSGVAFGGYAWHQAVGRSDPSLYAAPSGATVLAGAALVSPSGNADVDVSAGGTGVHGCAFTSSVSLGCF